MKKSAASLGVLLLLVLRVALLFAGPPPGLSDRTLEVCNAGFDHYNSALAVVLFTYVNQS